MANGRDRHHGGVDRSRLVQLGVLSVILAAGSVLLAASASCASEWDVEVVDGGSGRNVGKYSSVVIDRFGDFQIAYYDDTDQALYYGYRPKTGSQWFTMEIDRLAGTFLSLAVDSAGYPRIAYNSEYETGLHYAFWDGKEWHRMIIDHERTNRFASLELDAAGHPHISYYRENYGANEYALYLKYAWFDGKTWYVQTVDHRWLAGKANSLAVDSQGRPWIAYLVMPGGTGDLDYAHWDGARWQYGAADTQANNHGDPVGVGNSIAVGAHDQAHIAYLDDMRGVLKYASEINGVWHTEVVDQFTAREADWDRVSLKLDADDRPHIAYYDPGLGALKYAFKDAKGWHVELVDNAGNVGQYPSLALDADGVPYISYYDATDGCLKLAHLRVPPAPQPESKGR